MCLCFVVFTVCWLSPYGCNRWTCGLLCLSVGAWSNHFVNINTRNSWFQTFAVFWIYYVFFRVVPRRMYYICRRFGTLYLFHHISLISLTPQQPVSASEPPPTCHPRSYWLLLFPNRTFSCINTPTVLSSSHTSYHLPMKMEEIECSETSAYIIQTLGNYPKENIIYPEHGESLNSRIYIYSRSFILRMRKF